MTWDEVIAALRAGRFLKPLASLSPPELAERFEWSFFLRTDALCAWVKQDDWLDDAVRYNDPTAYPLLATLLERYVLDLGTRTEPALLLSFWARVAEAAGSPPAVTGVWTAHLPALAATAPESPPDLADIDAQEWKFVGILREVAGVVDNGPPVLGWAADTLRRVADRRTRSEVRTGRATVRVVFAWDWNGNAPPEARTAFLAEFELDDQLGARPGDFADPVRLFDPQFLAAARRAANAVGTANFHQLKFDTAQKGHAGLLTADQRLTGTSGGLAVTAAQLLANRRERDRWAAYTLPPWLVLSATLDEAGRRIVPVDALGDKIALLREEGVRAVGVADEQQQLAEAIAAAGRLRVVPCQGLPSTVATTLIDLGATWPVDLTRYKAWRGPSKRQVRMFVAVVGCMLLALSGLCVALLLRTAEVEKDRRQNAVRSRADLFVVADMLVKAASVDKFQAQAPDGQRALDMARGNLVKLARDTEREPELAGKVAEMYRQCGRLAFNLGDVGQAAIDYDDALRLAEQAVQTDDSPGNRLLLAKILRERGATRAAQGMVAEALPDWRRAQTLLEPLAPTDPDAKFTLAQLHMVLGNVADKPEALKEFDAGKRLIEDLLKTSPTNREYRFTLAEILDNKNNFLDDEPTESVAVCRHSVDIRKQLVKEQPNSPEQRAYYASSLNNLGEALQKLRPVPFAEAKAACEESVRIYKALVDAFPGVDSNRKELQDAEANLRKLLMKPPE